MEKLGSDELLRQNVFSSIHMSTAIRSNQVSVSYPVCSLCSVSLSGTSNKKAPRKVAVFQITLYTNSSESFIVWCKKPEEPKGILWLRSCCVRRGSDAEGGNMPIELLSKGCRGRCSHTLRFTSRMVAEEWYRLLKQESRKRTPMEGDDPFSSDSGEEDTASPLDRILSDTRTCGADGENQSFYPSSPNRRTSTPLIRTSKNYSDSDILSTSLPPRKPSNKGFRLPFGDRKISLPGQAYHHQRTVILESPADLDRWSWPVKV